MKDEKMVYILQGNIVKNILLFTLPIALSSMLQQLFNAVDTSVVGYFINADALAGVGTNGEIIALIVTISTGLSVGVNVLISNKIGNKDFFEIKVIIYTSVILATFIGILGLILGQFLSVPLLNLIKTPFNVLDDAVIYLRIYLLGYPFLLLYDFGSAILRAYGNSKYPFIALLTSGVANVVLNLCFVMFFKLGVVGVAMATDVATILSAIMVITKVHKLCKNLKSTRIKNNYLLKILKIGVPSAIQGAVFCFANIFVQTSVNSFGTVSTAGSTIAMNFEYFVYYMITAFGQTATTFTGHNYSARLIERCRKTMKFCILFSFFFSAVFVIPLVIFQKPISGIFSTDIDVIENSCLRIMCILAFEPICSFYEVPAGVLRGCGHSTEPALFTVVGTCAFRIIWICTVFKHIHTLKILFSAFPISWILTIALMWLGFVIIKPFKNKV